MRAFWSLYPDDTTCRRVDSINGKYITSYPSVINAKEYSLTSKRLAVPPLAVSFTGGMSPFPGVPVFKIPNACKTFTGFQSARGLF